MTHPTKNRSAGGMSRTEWRKRFELLNGPPDSRTAKPRSVSKDCGRTVVVDLSIDDDSRRGK